MKKYAIANQAVPAFGKYSKPSHGVIGPADNLDDVIYGASTRARPHIILTVTWAMFVEEMRYRKSSCSSLLKKSSEPSHNAIGPTDNLDDVIYDANLSHFGQGEIEPLSAYHCTQRII